MTSQIEINKKAVLRFNKEFIEQGNLDSFYELMDPDFVNRTAPEGADPGQKGMIHMIKNLLHVAFPDLQVEIFDQVAEGDKVATRKALTGTHTGPLMGIAPTQQTIRIEVFDMVRLRNGKYLEHWGLNTLPNIVAVLKSQQ